MSKQNSATENEQPQPMPLCFVIMPVSDPDGYVKGHFQHVYEDIILPACNNVGFQAIRADQVKQSNLIHLDVLQKLLNTPMAVCDLSSRNPNVLFELALRQAFDKPVALIQEVGTQSIFDIAPLRYTEYRKERIYHEVIEDQNKIAESIKGTYNAHKSGGDINSIVRLLGLSKSASIPEIATPEASLDLQKIVLAEISQLRDELRNLTRHPQEIVERPIIYEVASDLYLELERIKDQIDRLGYQITSEGKGTDLKKAKSQLSRLKYEIDEIRTIVSVRPRREISGKLGFRLNEITNELDSLELQLLSRMGDLSDTKG